MDIEGFSALSNAQIGFHDAQSRMITALSTAAVNYSQAGKLQAETEGISLDNLKKLIEIRWDVEARRHFEQQRIEALQGLRRAKKSAESISDDCRAVRILLTGTDDLGSVNRAWPALRRLERIVPIDVLGAQPSDSDARDSLLWKCTMERSPAQIDDGQSVIEWAIRNGCLPKHGTAAWKFVSDYLSQLSNGAKEAAKLIQEQIDAAKKDADALLAIDWDRLK